VQNENEKSLEMAVSQIVRQFGQGAIMKLGANEVQKVKAISTGAISLDLALGIGGVPRGRVVEIFGPESSGKCLVADTYLWTDRGMETVAELFDRLGQPASCTSRVTDVSDSGARAVNEDGRLEPITALTHNNRKHVVEITARSGRSVKVTKNHPLRVINERGSIVWRRAGDIAEGDVLVSAVFGAVESGGDDGITVDEAVLIGYLVAKGSLSSKTSIHFTNQDAEVGAEFTSLMTSMFDWTVELHNDQEYMVHSKRIRSEMAERCGLDFVTAAGKQVPHCIRVGGDKVQRAFLSALFEGDGWIDGSSTIGLGSASKTLATQVQLMLYGLGIPASLSSKFNREYERDHWTVTINPAVAHRFLDEVGFRSKRRSGQVAVSYRRSSRDPQFENIPHLTELIRDLRDAIGGDREFDRIAGDLFRHGRSLDVSRTRLRRIVEWASSRHCPVDARWICSYLASLAESRYTFEPVTEVRDGGLQPTFDIVVPETHSFLANGVLSHNTTLALHVVAEAQRNGGAAAFIDAEHALDPVYAKAIGVDIDELLISQPDTGEQALEIADMLIRSGALDVVVIDSVAALVPRAELEGDMGDTHVGLQARLMSQALRKLAGTINRSDTTAVFINQLREKIGVMFGCMQYSTRVTLADGTQEKIGKIVDQRMDVEVLAVDPETGSVEPKKIVDWFDNGEAERFLQFTVYKPQGNGRAQFAATELHRIATPVGWREARDLTPGDSVMMPLPHYLSDQQRQLVLGGLMGDGSISRTRVGASGVTMKSRFRFGQGRRQDDYALWKASLLAGVPVSVSPHSEGGLTVETTPLVELDSIRDAVYIAGEKVFSWDYLKELTPFALAIWYMDDGTFVERRADGSAGRSEICVEAMESTTRDRVADLLRDTFGLSVSMRDRAGEAVLVFDRDGTEALHGLIAPYVPDCMSHKLLRHHRGVCEVAVVPATERLELVPVPILSISEKPRTKSMRKFDLEIEGYHNYLVDGVMVHNSPETTPGGRALKFYASVRIDVRRIESIKQGTDTVGNRVRAKIVKNKVAPPFRLAEFDIMFGEGISREGSLLDVAVDEGIVKKAGAWYTFDGDQLGQGREKAKEFLKLNPEIAMQLQDQVLTSVGMHPVSTDEVLVSTDDDGDAAGTDD
jgi:recombination protein RecA